MRPSMFRPVAVITVIGGLVVGTALPAFAHHPELSGIVACTSGQQVITWTVRNSETTSGSNRTMTIDQISATSGTVEGLVVGTVFPPQPKAGSVRTATTTVSGTKTGSVTLTVRGDWAGGSQNVVRTVRVTLPGGCTVPTTTSTSTTTTSTTTTSTTTTSSTTTTTTTAPPPSTTSSTTTTTRPPTTTTTEPPTTTTTEPPTTTTTEPPTTTTTGGPTTTTTTPSTTTTTLETTVLGTTLTKPLDTPQVLGEEVTKPAPSAPLARTGAAIGVLAFLGGALLWIGLPLTRYKRRRNLD